jgi:hypothetical protein
MLDRKLVKSVATQTLLMMGKSIPVAGKASLRSLCLLP